MYRKQDQHQNQRKKKKMKLKTEIAGNTLSSVLTH